MDDNPGETGISRKPQVRLGYLTDVNLYDFCFLKA